MTDIITFEKKKCFLCGSYGELIYKNLTDKLFGAPGLWNIVKCQNNKCGLLWLNPVPEEENISFAYKNYYTHSEEDENLQQSFKKKFYKSVQDAYLASEYGYGEKKHLLLKYFLWLDWDRLEQTKYRIMYLKNTGGRLLDIGCGNGKFIRMMKEYGWETTGIDFDENAVKVAQSENMNVKLGGLTEQNFPEEFFDIITLAHVLEHIYDPFDLIQNCKKILKKTGKIVIATPNNESFGHKHFRESWRGLEPPRHIHIFSPSSLEELIKLSGFQKYNLFTTPNLARFIFLNSGDLLSYQRSNSLSKYSVLKAKIFSLMEMLLILFNKNYGEELILIAEK